MNHIFSLLIFIIIIFIYIYNNQNLIDEPTLINKFLIFLWLRIINIIIIIFKQIKKKTKLEIFSIIKDSIYYSFIGVFGYILYFDLIKFDYLKTIINSSKNIAIFINCLLISILTVIFSNNSTN
mgnify:CR=1 FL=1